MIRFSCGGESPSCSWCCSLPICSPWRDLCKDTSRNHQFLWSNKLIFCYTQCHKAAARALQSHLSGSVPYPTAPSRGRLQCKKTHQQNRQLGLNPLPRALSLFPQLQIPARTCHGTAGQVLQLCRTCAASWVQLKQQGVTGSLPPWHSLTMSLFFPGGSTASCTTLQKPCPLTCWERPRLSRSATTIQPIYKVPYCNSVLHRRPSSAACSALRTRSVGGRAHASSHVMWSCPTICKAPNSSAAATFLKLQSNIPDKSPQTKP